MTDRRSLYRTLLEARALEETIASVQPFYHSGFGMEACGVGVCALLREDDALVAHYRGVGAPLAKGMSPFELLTTYLLKATSPVRGRVWHPVDVRRRLYGHQGTSGSEFGRAAGLALAAKVLRPGTVAVGMFGDGSAHRGTLHEAFLTARSWRLPVVWVCENNGWMISTPTERVFPRGVAELAAGYGMPSVVLDGNDVFAVAEGVAPVIERVRSTGEQAFVELRTYRVRSHLEAEEHDYQDPAEIERWRERDPVAVARRRLVEEDGADPAELDALETEVRAAIADALARARAEPDVGADADAFAGLYATSGGAGRT